MPPIRTILHPTDFSASSGEAFYFAESLAAQHAARLIVLHVSQNYPGTGGEVPEKFVTDDVRQGMNAIQPRDPAVHVQRIVLAGPTAEVIVGFAEKNACDLIVMGTHGRSGMAHVLVGSVAEKVVRDATCPVLTVKLPRSHGKRES